jgi:predicted ATP-dependent endonuclease of OLD family
MIVSVLIRHYKAFNGISHIPITLNDDFTVFFGANGVGKSSVLESLDTFFNNREWNINKIARSHGFKNTNIPYVLPVFLIKKENAALREGSEIKEKIEKLSECFWNIKRENINNNSEAVINFFDFRDKLGGVYSQYEHYLLLAGKRYDRQTEIYFGPFHNQQNFLHLIGLINGASQENNTDETEKSIQNYCKGIMQFIIEQYSYIYIPSDIDIQNYTKLENQDMQKLMHNNVHEEIKNAITQTKLDDINQSLKLFVDNISSKLIDYEYQKPTEGKSTIDMTDLISKIIETYFSIRVLGKRNNDKFIPVNDLSSGEKRKALVDLAYAFLNEREKHDKKIILGIDEPEASLHISACFEQFEKLRKIANNEHQVIITTHWYGFLPVVNTGYAHNVFINNGEIFFNTYSLEKFQEEITLTKRHEKGKLPFDIYLKSSNDLIQSIISALRAEKPYNYIFCEGSSDSIYLKHYLSYFLDNNNLRILPLGGCSEVIKLIKNISLILEDKNVSVKGRIIGLIDTDEYYEHIDDIKDDKQELRLRRILFDRTINDIKIVPPNDKQIISTQIEHTLNTSVFLKTIEKHYNKKNINNFINSSTVNTKSNCVFNIIDFTDNQKYEFNNFFKETVTRKTDFAQQYIKIANTIDHPCPKLYQEIIELFEFQKDVNTPKTISFVNNIPNNTRKTRVVIKRKK